MRTVDFPTPPQNGIHNWVIAAAWHCRRTGVDPIEAVRLIQSHDSALRRPLQPREASDAVEKVYAAKLDPSVRLPRRVELPVWNQAETLRIYEEAGTAVEDLLVLSPEYDPPEILTRNILNALFPDSNGLLCVGKSAYEFMTAPLTEHKVLFSQQFVVPAYMTATSGTTQAGKQSMHTKSNTGPRRYIVCDFDEPAPEQHPAIIMHLAKFRPLTMVLSSGGKSLHAWFPVTASAADDRLFWRLCIALGADPALMRNHSQFVRMPNGTRDNGKRQHCVYFNPAAAP